jgi:hypothetical protein
MFVTRIDTLEYLSVCAGGIAHRVTIFPLAFVAKVLVCRNGAVHGQWEFQWNAGNPRPNHSQCLVPWEKVVQPFAKPFCAPIKPSL